MDDYYEWKDGSEEDIEGLLIWWASREEFVHEDNCPGPNYMHCCRGKHKNNPNIARYGLESSTPPWNPIIINFIDNGEKTPIDFGDRIYYRGDWAFELVKRG